ncbi:MAG: 50S ribosomal protein L9 [Deltaproteobacteria bacterium]|nr:50S ribosomal protein L9 [Deltaproteobacteria bacterium]
MKVILKTEVENLGSFGAQVRVAQGYARNYLIPKGLAVEATPGNINQFNAEKEAYLKKAQARKEKAEKLKGELEAISLAFTRKAGEDEKLFGSVTVHDIESGLSSKGFEIERKNILLEEPIKAVGQYTVAVKLHPEVTATVQVGVAKE